MQCYKYTIVGGEMTADAAVPEVLLWKVWGKPDFARSVISIDWQFLTSKLSQARRNRTACSASTVFPHGRRVDSVAAD